MTKKEAREKTRKLVRNCAQSMRKNIEKILENKSVDISSYDNNYVLPKIILAALLKEEMFQGQPLRSTKERNLEIERIYRSL